MFPWPDNRCIPLSSVIRSARWRALAAKSVDRIRVMKGRPTDLIMEKWPVSEASSFACFS